jgi:MFS transporter, OFA family, oxalate/formate antiporter
MSETLDSSGGWRVVWGTHLVMAVSFGSAYSFSAVFPGLSSDFNASRGEVALVFSLSAFVFYCMGAIAGPFADRWSTRALVLAGLIAMTVGYVGGSRAGSLTALYAWYGLGVGVGIGLSYVPALGAVQSWFHVRRSRASGIATAGLGLGTLTLPLAVGMAVPHIGWRVCFLALALIIAIVGWPAALFIRKRREVTTEVQPTNRPSLISVWRDGNFRRYYAMLLFASFCTFIPLVHIVPAARDMGLSIGSGSMLIALIGIGNIFGRFVLAGLGDRVGRLRLLAILTFAVAGCFVLWCFAAGFAMLATFAVLFGMSYGGCVGLYPAVAADLFGTRRIGAMLGYLYTAVGVAALIGPPATGFIFDRTGSYRGPIIASTVVAVVAGVLVLRLQRLNRPVSA